MLKDKVIEKWKKPCLIFLMESYIHYDRVCYIVGNRHTKSKINGLDFQIIWEMNFNDEDFRKCI